MVTSGFCDDTGWVILSGHGEDSILIVSEYQHIGWKVIVLLLYCISGFKSNVNNYCEAKSLK